ncbi:DNA repair protein [Trichinella pseudospiralis]
MAFVRCRRRGILTYVCSTVVGCWVFFSTGRFLHNAQQNFFAHIAASLEHPSCSAISNAQCQLSFELYTKQARETKSQQRQTTSCAVMQKLLTVSAWME